jgi:hypothetical protein
MILGLRENEEDVRNATFDDLGQLSFLVQDSAQDERKRVQHRVAGQNPAEVVLRRRALTGGR